jgi:hypothetical protein
VITVVPCHSIFPAPLLSQMEQKLWIPFVSPQTGRDAHFARTEPGYKDGADSRQPAELAGACVGPDFSY